LLIKLYAAVLPSGINKLLINYFLCYNLFTRGLTTLKLDYLIAPGVTVIVHAATTNKSLFKTGNSMRADTKLTGRSMDVVAAEIEYNRRQNNIVLASALPSIAFFACLYFYLQKYFHFALFIIWLVDIFAGITINRRLKTISAIALNKRITAGIGFALLATNLLVGLWDSAIYYIVLPWCFLFPMVAVMFYGRKTGVVTAFLFCVLAIAFLLLNDVPPLEGRAAILLRLNAIIVIITVLLQTIVYEKTRIKIQDELAASKNEYRRAEARERKANIELTQEMESRREARKALAESELHYRALFEESTMALWDESWPGLKKLLDGLPDEARSNLDSYFDTHPGAISQYTPLLKVNSVNRAALKLMEADTQADLLEKLPRQFALDKSGFLARRIASLYRSGNFDTEIVAYTLKGKKRHLLVSSSIPAGYEQSWEKVFSSVYDLTERIELEDQKKRMEQQMQGARQFQAVATLAGGIAHRFNNALTIIFGNLDLLEMITQGSLQNQKILASLKASAGRMSRLTEQLIAYARGGKYQPQDFSINVLVNSIVNSKVLLRDSDKHIVARLGEDMPFTFGDTIQIKMVVEAVVANALEAIGSGGTVLIMTGRRLIEDKDITPQWPTRPGEYVFICIEDDGAGMNEEVLQRIFEPFFTTKIYGRGLGMAAAYGVIKNHDGFITVESKEGRGTKVFIYLPGALSFRQTGSPEQIRIG
jgi:signal transduction histidine kinase